MTSHSLAHSFAHPVTYTLTQPLTNALTHALAHSFTHSLTHLLTYSPTVNEWHTLTHSLTHLWMVQKPVWRSVTKKRSPAGWHVEMTRNRRVSQGRERGGRGGGEEGGRERRGRGVWKRMGDVWEGEEEQRGGSMPSGSHGRLLPPCRYLQQFYSTYFFFEALRFTRCTFASPMFVLHYRGSHPGFVVPDSLTPRTSRGSPLACVRPHGLQRCLHQASLPASYAPHVSDCTGGTQNGYTRGIQREGWG